jgi:Immunity protein 26
MLKSLSTIKRQRRRPGKIVKIDLGNSEAALGLVLTEPLIAFYDKQFGYEEVCPKYVSDLPILFTLMVMNHAVISGRWTIVGESDIPDNLKVPPKFCKEDLVSGEKSIYQEIPELAPHYERPATPDECDGLEAAAVWEAQHVEDRLRDHFAGVPNKWVQQLRHRI